MNTLIVTAHPESGSLTHAVAEAIAGPLRAAGGRVEIADLAAEGFDPRFCPADLAVHRQQAAPPADVLAEQARVDRAGRLVLVFPVYWWSMPALLKGWIDRVFSNGWAFDFRPGAPLAKKLGRLRVQLVGLGGADAATYARHRYDDAMRVQLEHGIFDYCGVRAADSTLLLDSEGVPGAETLARAAELGRALAEGGADDASRS